MLNLLNIPWSSVKSGAESLAIVVTFIVIAYDSLKHKLQMRRSRSITHTLYKGQQIQEKLTELRVLLDADRVKLFRFHNGDYYINGDSAMRCSMTHLSVQDGISYPTQTSLFYSRTLVTTLLHYISPLANGKIFFSNTKDLPDDDWKKVLTLNGSRTLLIKRIGSVAQMQGFVKVTWHEEHAIPSDEILEKAAEVLDKISLIMRKS